MVVYPSGITMILTLSLVFLQTWPSCLWGNLALMLSKHLHFWCRWYAQISVHGLFDSLYTGQPMPSLFSRSNERTIYFFKGEWTATLFSHLDSWHSIDHLDPHLSLLCNSTILLAVLVLKHVFNTAKQINDRKVCLCVNGSFQNQRSRLHWIFCANHFGYVYQSFSCNWYISALWFLPSWHW